MAAPMKNICGTNFFISFCHFLQSYKKADYFVAGIYVSDNSNYSWLKYIRVLSNTCRMFFEAISFLLPGRLVSQYKKTDLQDKRF